MKFQEKVEEEEKKGKEKKSFFKKKSLASGIGKQQWKTLKGGDAWGECWYNFPGLHPKHREDQEMQGSGLKISLRRWGDG